MMHQLESINRYLLHYDEIVGEHAKIVRRCADRFVCLCLNWLPREARDSERNEASDGEPGCEAHAQLRSRKGPDSSGWWQAIAHKWRGGLLGIPADLCTPCWERACRTGVKPSADDVAHYQRTSKWPKRHEAKAS
jgi:hypothetical protein